MPEGSTALLEAWGVLRLDLDRDVCTDGAQMQIPRAVNLTGVRSERSHDTRIGDLSNALWGEFHNLTAQEGGDLDNEARRNWARAELLKLVDDQIAELVAHKATLDLDRIEQDRREAPARAKFDDSKQASLARRYEADSDRGFYKALNYYYGKSRAEAQTRIETARCCCRSQTCPTQEWVRFVRRPRQPTASEPWPSWRPQWPKTRRSEGPMGSL